MVSQCNNPAVGIFYIDESKKPHLINEVFLEYSNSFLVSWVPGIFTTLLFNDHDPIYKTIITFQIWNLQEIINKTLESNGEFKATCIKQMEFKLADRLTLNRNSPQPTVLLNDGRILINTSRSRNGIIFDFADKTHINLDTLPEFRNVKDFIVGADGRFYLRENSFDSDTLKAVVLTSQIRAFNLLPNLIDILAMMPIELCHLIASFEPFANRFFIPFPYRQPFPWHTQHSNMEINYPSFPSIVLRDALLKKENPQEKEALAITQKQTRFPIHVAKLIVGYGFFRRENSQSISKDGTKSLRLKLKNHNDSKR